MSGILRRARICGSLIILTLLATTACGQGGGAGSDELTVFAAASLTDAFTEVGAAFEQDQGASVSFNFAGSQALVTQLAEGADASILATANTQQMQRAADAGVLADDWVTFARNKLVIIVPDDNPANINQPQDLAREDLKLAIAAEDVPAGHYTSQMLELLATSPAAPPDFVERVTANIVSNDSNVRLVVTKVQLGEADAGIVYATDVTANVHDDVQVIEIPDQYNIIADYPVALVTDGNADLGNAFIDFLLSDAGQQILQEYGFIAAAG